MANIDFNNIDHWVFDLDNTLYPSHFGFFDLISERITQYVMAHFNCERNKAKTIQKSYFTQYGTTLNGLMALHNIDPQDYLQFVHDINLSRLNGAPNLAPLITQLPGKKYIFTNGDADYAWRVLDKLGLSGIFDMICDIGACNYRPKPEMIAYQTLIQKSGIDPLRTVFFEDMARNLEPAKALGMATVWIDGKSDWGAAGMGDFIDIKIDSMTDFLTQNISKIGKTL